jgi:hypothetical protein
MPLSEAEELELLELEKERATATAKPKPGMMESFVRGAGQAATFGFEDEARAALMAPFSDKSYTELRDEIRTLNDEAKKENPKTFLAGELSGGLATAFVPGVAPAKAASTGAKILQAAGIGAAYGLGNSEADLTKGQFVDAAKDTAIGAGTGAAAGALIEKVIAPGLGKVVKGGRALSEKLYDKADELAETATGATRVQADKFASGTGRQIRKDGVVGLWDHPADIAKKATEKLGNSGEAIEQALLHLDEQGVTIHPDEIMGALDQRIADLKLEGPGFGSDWRSLEAIKEDLAQSIQARGNQELPISVVEGMKRTLKRAFKSADEGVRKGSKEAYRALMDLVETKATTADEALGELFTTEKNNFRVYSPVADAAEKRALQLKQQPILGLNDIASAGAGAFAGDPTGGLATAAARRYAAPRLPGLGSKVAGLSGDAASGGSAFLESFLKNPASQNPAPVIAGNFGLRPDQVNLPKVAERDPIESLMSGNNMTMRKGFEMASQLPDKQFEQVATQVGMLSEHDPEFNIWNSISTIGPRIEGGQMEAGGAAIVGGLVNRYGTRDSKEILKALSQMEGIPTVEKIQKLSLPQSVRDDLEQQLLQKVDSAGIATRPVTVPPAMRRQIRHEIRNSDALDNIEKARNLDMLNRKGQVQDLGRVMSGGKKFEVPPIPAKPTPKPGEKLRNAADFIRSKKVEPY